MLLASNLDFLQGTFKKIQLHSLVCQHPLELADLFAQRRLSRVLWGRPLTLIDRIELIAPADNSPLRRNTQAIVALAGEKSRQARLRVIEAIAEMQHEGIAINFNAICLAARVSKTFLYDPKHSDLAQQIRSFRQTHPQSSSSHRSNKSDSAKDAQIARFKERVRQLEAQVRSLKDENELLYGKLTDL